MIEEGELSLEKGLVGDSWVERSTDRDTQVTLMNARCIDLLAKSQDRWELAGDQFYVDLDLSTENLPPGTRLQLGSAVIEVATQPHRGCGKFSRRFGVEALRFVNSGVGQQLRLRGLYARVVLPGTASRGDTISKC